MAVRRQVGDLARLEAASVVLHLEVTKRPRRLMRTSTCVASAWLATFRTASCALRYSSARVSSAMGSTPVAATTRVCMPRASRGHQSLRAFSRPSSCRFGG